MATLVAGNHLHVLGAVGQSPLFDGWEDGNDWYLVGDFMGMGHHQVMFLNRSGSGGRGMIADFTSGKQPAQVLGAVWAKPTTGRREDDNDWFL